MPDFIEQMILATQEFIAFRKRLFKMCGSFGDLLFECFIGLEKSRIGFLQLFRGDLQLLKRNLEFLVDDG